MSNVKFTCQECGKDFEVYPSRAKKQPKFCSKECKYKNIRERETTNRVKVNCDNCGIEVVKYNCRLSNTDKHFCCMSCHDEYRSKQIEIPCEECGNLFKAKVSRIEKQNPRYCSMKCRDKAFRGENSPLYTKRVRKCKQCDSGFIVKQSELDYGKGLYCSKRCYYKSLELDRPSDSEHFYGSSFWRKLRNECYERDNYTCQRCGITEGKLDAHHIVPRVFGGKDTIDNLISLCCSCHHIVEHETRKKYS